MPPKKKISKDFIISKAFEIVKTRGASELNARSLAKEMNCSTQPIFSEFKSMDDVKKEVRLIAYKLFDDFPLEVVDSCGLDEYSLVCIGYKFVRFALKYPKLIELLFLDLYPSRMDDFRSHFKTFEIMTIILNNAGFNYEQCKAFMVSSWSFLYGLSLVLTTGNNYYSSDDELKEFIRLSIYGLFEKFKKSYTKDA